MQNSDEKVNLNQIMLKLFEIPSEKLYEAADLIETILKEKDLKSVRRTEKLEGIWEGIGFEQLSDLDEDIREMRRHSEKSLPERILTQRISQRTRIS